MRTRLLFEAVEPRVCLSAVTFVEELIESAVTGNGVEVPDVADVAMADIDGDGDSDILTVFISTGKIVWYENTDGAGRFGDQRLIATNAGGASLEVLAADLDGDSDLDVLSTAYNSHTIVWYENTDGAGQFGDQRLIATPGHGGKSLFAADLDGDGDIDVVSVSRKTGRIAWYENTDRAGKFGAVHVISAADRPAFSDEDDVSLADLDDDGDVDIVSSSVDGITWYENIDAGDFGDQEVIIPHVGRVNTGVQSTLAADLDGDGDFDVVSYAGDGTYEFVWYENTDGAGQFGAKRLISTPRSVWGCVRVADLDGDDDLDLLSCHGTEGSVVWYENLDGAGDFGAPRFVSEIGHSPALDAADIDGDGDLDVVVGSGYFFFGKIAWYENRLIGDSNNDGVFNSSDLVVVFAAGKFKNDFPGNTSFDEGDWNQDGKFNNSDLVRALAAGHYESSPASVAGVESAIDWLFARDEHDKRAFMA